MLLAIVCAYQKKVAKYYISKLNHFSFSKIVNNSSNSANSAAS